MELVCQKCGSDNNLVSVSLGDIFLGYLCTQDNLEFTKILIKMQEGYFQESVKKFKEFVKGS